MLLNFPIELVIKIMSLLPYDDLLRCRQVRLGWYRQFTFSVLERHLKQVSKPLDECIRGNEELQYIVEQAVAGCVVQDQNYTHEKMQCLMAWQTMWRAPRVRQTSKYYLPGVGIGLGLCIDWWYLGGGCLRLINRPEHENEYCGEPVISNMGHPQFNADPEHDGLKVITTTIDCEGVAIRICLDYAQDVLILAIQMRGR